MAPYFMWLFLLFELRGCLLTSVSVPCGQPIFRPRFSRIVGGEPARVGTWPWAVMLADQGFQACGGTLIHPNWVLTAAHCFVEEGNNASRWQVHAGKHHVYVADPPEQSSAVNRIIIHQNFSQETVENDIALLQLVQPFTYSMYIRPSCLVTPAIELYPERRCVSVGWGSTLGTSDDSALNQVIMPLIDGAVCTQPTWYGTDFYPSTMMCAGFERGAMDTCQGDSGGPLVCYEDGVWYLAGVTSWGVNCAVPRQPGVYARVSVYVDWIKGILAQNGQPYQY